MISIIPQVKVLTTSGSRKLAQGVCAELTHRLPSQLRAGKSMQLSEVNVEKFSNENILVQVENVRGCLVVVIVTQTNFLHDNLFEFFAILDAVDNAHAADVFVVFPCMPYARSDLKNKPRISAMAKRLADFLCKTYNIKNVLLMDPHDGHVKHYFEPAADEITASYLLVDYIQKKYFPTHAKEGCTLVFADAGAAKRFERVPDLLGIPSAYFDKRRANHDEQPEVKRLVGDVRERDCIILDDEILTARTLLADAETLLKPENKARSVSSATIHGVLARKSVSNEEFIASLEASPIEQFILTSSVPVEKVEGREKFKVLNTNALIAEGIARIVTQESVTELHSLESVDKYRPSYD